MVRTVLIRCAVLIAALVAPLSASWCADVYPSRPIRIIVPWPPGGNADVRARTIAAPLATALGQPVIVENRPGAAGAVGAAATAKAPADGYTIMWCSVNELALAPAINPNMLFEPARDLAPITQVAMWPTVLLVNPGVHIASWRELVVKAKAHDSEWAFASSGVASLTHVAGEVLASALGIRLTHVPYKGAAPGLMAAIAGETQFAFDSPNTSAPFVDAGQLRALLVLGKRRVPLFPGVPSATEVGLPQLDLPLWGGFCAPVTTRPEIIYRLYVETRKVLALPAIHDAYTKAAAQIVGSTPAEFGAFIRAEQIKWAALVKSNNIKAE